MSTDAVLAAIDGAVHDWTTSGDAMRWRPEPVQSYPPQGAVIFGPEQLRVYMQRVGQQVQAFAKMYIAAAYKATQLRRTALAMHRVSHEAGQLSQPIARCHICRPRANPPASPVAAAYRRRQVARRRRARRAR